MYIIHLLLSVLILRVQLKLIMRVDQIDREREGDQIDVALLRNVIDCFVEIGMGQMECYKNDFEDKMLKDSAAYYSRKALKWIVEDSCPDYMLKVNLFVYYVMITPFLFVNLVR